MVKHRLRCAPNNSPMLTRLAGENAVALGLPTSYRMRGKA